MNQTDKGNAILFIRPNAEFVIRDNVLEWLDDNQIEPTEAEIEQGLKDYKAAEKAKLKSQSDAKAAAQAKLAALGLTVEDLQALGL
jgi:hypothetical protein